MGIKTSSNHGIKRSISEGPRKIMAAGKLAEGESLSVGGLWHKPIRKKTADRRKTVGTEGH